MYIYIDIYIYIFIYTYMEQRLSGIDGKRSESFDRAIAKLPMRCFNLVFLHKLKIKTFRQHGIPPGPVPKRQIKGQHNII